LDGLLGLTYRYGEGVRLLYFQTEDIHQTTLHLFDGVGAQDIEGDALLFCVGDDPGALAIVLLQGDYHSSLFQVVYDDHRKVEAAGSLMQAIASYAVGIDV
jgi:hypothetical protein